MKGETIIAFFTVTLAIITTFLILNKKTSSKHTNLN